MSRTIHLPKWGRVLLTIFLVLGGCYYLGYVQLYKRLVIHSDIVLPSKQSLENYYEGIHRDNIIPILNLLEQVQDQDSAKKVLAELSTHAIGINRSWASLYEKQNGMNTYDEYSQLQQLLATDRYYNKKYAETIQLLTKEYNRLSQCDFYGQRHIEDIILTYLLSFENKEARPLWSPLLALEEQVDIEEFDNTLFNHLKHLLLPSAYEWPERANLFFEHFTVYLYSERVKHSFPRPYPMHHFYTLASSYLQKDQNDGSKNQSATPFAEMCFCPWTYINTEYKIPESAKIDIGHMDFERVPLDSLLATPFSEFIKHKQFLQTLENPTHGGRIIVMQLNSPCRYKYMIIGFEQNKEQVSKIALSDSLIGLDETLCPS